jgi:hypothetical protein
MMSLICVFDHPHMVVQAEYKTKWAAPLIDFPGYFQREDRHNALERQSIDAVHQLYGYMTLATTKPPKSNTCFKRLFIDIQHHRRTPPSL